METANGGMQRAKVEWCYVSVALGTITHVEILRMGARFIRFGPKVLSNEQIR
jgi:L-lysine 2,3-aminomutase